MRNIKFRAWDVKDKEFLDVGRLYQEDEIYVVEEHPDCGDRVLFVGESGGERKNEVELMQYTGIRDKNGAEIYEGDILSTDLDRPYLIVEFRNGAFMFQCHDNGKDYYDFMATTGENSNFTKYHEVIGSIYENSELLEDEVK